MLANITFPYSFITNMNGSSLITHSPVCFFGKIIRNKTVTQKTHKHRKLSTSENKKPTSSSAQMEEEFSLTDLPFTTASQSRCQEGLIYKTILYTTAWNH